MHRNIELLAMIFVDRKMVLVPGGQGSLDDIVTRQPRAPPFSTTGLLDYLVELVVCEDKVEISDSSLSWNS